MFAVIPPSKTLSMVGTLVPSELIEKLFSTDETSFEEMNDKILENYSAYFIEYNGLVFKFEEDHLERNAYFVGFTFDGDLEFDYDGNMKTTVDIKKLKSLLSEIGVVSPRITYLHATH